MHLLESHEDPELTGFNGVEKTAMWELGRIGFRTREPDVP